MTQPTRGRSYPTRRAVNPHPAPELADAVQVSRFWRMVDRRADDECWPWTGDTDEDGYGVFFYQGKKRGAHELALTFTTGESRPPGHDTRHDCDNPPCCNPGELRWGTRQDNVDDMFGRGRQAVGADRRSAKLTDDDVKTIRERRSRGALQKALAEEYGVSGALISDIVNGLRWTHVGGPITGRSKRTKLTPRSRTGKVA